MSNDLMRTTTDADRRDKFEVEQTGDGDAERGTRGVTRSMMAPLVLQAVGSTPVVVVAIVLLVIVLLVWVWMRGDKQKRGDESRPQLEEGEKPSGDILDQREEVDEPVDVDEDMSLAEVKKAKMAKVKGEDKERRKAGVATEEAREEHAEQDEVDRVEAEEAEEVEADEPEEEQEAEDAELEEPSDGLAEDETDEGADDESVDEEETDEDDTDEEEAEADAELEEDDSAGLGIPDPSDAGLVDESEAEEPSEATDEESQDEGRERKGSGISVPTPDDVSESDIGTSPDDDEEAEEDAEEEPDEATEEPEEAADEETTDGEGPYEEPSEEEAADEEPADDEPSDESEEDELDEDDVAEEGEADEPKTLEKGLEKTREGLIGQLSSLFTGDTLDDEIVEEVEEVLITADVGPKVTRKIIDALEEQLEGEQKNDPGKVWGFIRQHTKELLQAHEAPLDVDADKPYVILVVGVNGVGKTTTIGKMASKFKRQGKSVMLVAGDTFRAGAVDQLGIWAERTDLPMHKGDEGADPASVIYGGIERGIEEGTDVVICDTSGRLHTDKNLMEELKKMERVAGNAKEGAPHEVHLVLDANTGQNAIAQAEKFFEALDVSGMTLTKFDGTARGGVILGVCDRFEAPVRYVGIGEHVADLREFDAEEFVEALFM